jgi:hypothetical protein
MCPLAHVKLVLYRIPIISPSDSFHAVLAIEDSMNATTGERWVKYILSCGAVSSGIYLMGFGCLMNLAASLYLGVWTDSRLWGMFLALGVQSGYTVMIYWERNGWIRLVEKKDAEIQSLRRELELTREANARGTETRIEPHLDA